MYRAKHDNPRSRKPGVSRTECWSLGAFVDDDGHTARQILTSCVHNTFSSSILLNGDPANLQLLTVRTYERMNERFGAPPFFNA
jgi:hypothetical protein